MSSLRRLLQNKLTIALALAALLYLVPIAFVLRNHIELGRVALGADALLSGHLLYRDYFSEALPGSYFVVASFF